MTGSFKCLGPESFELLPLSPASNIHGPEAGVLLSKN